MDKQGMLEAFEKCLKTVGELTEMVAISMTRYDGNWNVELTVWPPNQDKPDHATIAKCTSLTGKLERHESLGWFKGEKDGLSVQVIVNKPCKIIGYKVERVPVRKFIETGDFEDKRTPVTDCDIKQGKVNVGEYEPAEVN